MLGENSSVGWALGGSWQRRLNDLLALRLSVDLSRHAYKGPLEGEQLHLLPVMANLVHYSPRGFYALAGLGLVRAAYLGTSEIDPTWDIGGGFNLNSWFVEVRYQSSHYDGGSTVTLPIVVGWRF